MPLRFSPARGASVLLSASSRGPAGTDGDDGAAATIAVGTVTTLAAGASATVANVGTSAAAVFDFGIPQGVAGALGASGTPTVGQFGIWTNATTQKGVSITGLVKGNGASDPAAAAAGTDYVAPGGALGTPSSGTLTACTGLPVAGITASTATALGVGTVELGHATDTTLSRSSAGVLAVEGVTVALNSTSAVHTAGTIELGAATDTTLSRSAAGVMAVEGVPLYPNIPQNSQSAAYTLVLADAQKHILHPTADNNARTFTIPANASVAFPIGSAVTFINEINTVTIAITSDTLTLAGAGSTGSRTLAANGIATAIKVTSTKWVISGTGLT